MRNDTNKVSIHWQELDVLRGLAALLMVVNHTGYKTIAPAQIHGSLAESLLFISSFAPVLFFFVTGIGYGIQSSQRKKASHWYVVFNKVVILFLADLLMHWSEGRWLGLDFLGFIGLSSLVLEFLRKSKSPVTYAVAGFVLVSLMRYLLGPWVHSHGYDQQMGVGLSWVLGTSSLSGVSYPLSPWLAYPFAGYLFGVAAMHYREVIEKYRLRMIAGLLVLGLFPAIAGVILAQHGASFFRWGTVGLGFYIVSFALMLGGLACSLAICTGLKPEYQNAISLKGIASLAVVPIHYFVLELIALFGENKLNLLEFFLTTLAVLTVSFLLARLTETTSKTIRQSKRPSFIWCGLVAAFVLAVIIMLSLSKDSKLAIASARTVGQLILCYLFVVHPQFSNRQKLPNFS